MKRRRWTNSGLEDFGILKSALRDLDTVETAMEGLSRIDAEIGRAADINIEINKAEASLGSAAAEIKRTGVGILDAISTVNDKIPTIHESMGRVSDVIPGMDLATRIAGQIPPLTESPSLGIEFRTVDVFGGTLHPVGEAMAGLSTIHKANDLWGSIAKPEPPGLFSQISGIETGWSKVTSLPRRYTGLGGPAARQVLPSARLHRPL